jgi:hypothetical protein
MDIQEKLYLIQSELVAPKNMKNNFGNYNYRSCEGILESLKPLLFKYKCSIILTDSLEAHGDRVYIKAVARLQDGESGGCIESVGIAREAAIKKGMDDSQISGSTSSYSRKYALNGLFAIDDNKDADALNTHGKDVDSMRKELTLLLENNADKFPDRQEGCTPKGKKIIDLSPVELAKAISHLKK